MKSIGYEHATKALHVEFHGSGVYEYSNVPPEEHMALMKSHSVGKRLSTHVKGVYPARRL